MNTDPLAASGYLTGEQARSFASLIAESRPLLSKVRVIRMPGTDDRCMAEMRESPATSTRYARALASLARVKLHKARVFLGLDRGYLTATARRLLTEALERAALSGKTT